MGSGTWSTATYTTNATTRAASGTSAFAYSDSGARKVHEDLDPAKFAVRESRDSDEHPNSVPIAVMFDVTGSMGRIPRQLQEKMPELFGLLLRKGYVADPQIMFGAVGDATCDRVPLQMGQFESDNRMDDDLGKIVIEGGGGGQMTESYELALYALARKTSTDRHEKHQKKGYAFLIGDETAYPKVKAREVKALTGEDIGEDIPMEYILAEAQEKYHVFFIIPTSSYNGRDPKLQKYWIDLMGDNVLFLEDTDAVCETIALAIGITEGTIDLAEGIDDLTEGGSKATDVVKNALATYSPGGGRVPVRAGGESAVTRL